MVCWENDMNYQEAEDYIYSLPKFTTKNSLEHTRQFLKRLNAEGREQKILHIAGTNGKGSVCAYLQALLLSEGKTVGMFTSPHLVKMNERICVNGQAVADEVFLESFERVRNAVKKMQEEGIAHPTFFEFLFGMGMDIFAESGVEYIILETGLGGRLDATNAIGNPVISIITSISLDHTEILGETVAEIAAEKAGIIKPGVPVIFDGNCEEGAKIIRDRAGELGAPCREITKNAYEIQKTAGKDIAFSSVSAYYETTVWHLSTTALYQPMNAMLALEVMRSLWKEEKHLDRWQKALAGVHWAGRMEEAKPGIFLDGAHNLGAVKAFAESVSAKEKGGKRVILFSAVQDKDYEHMIRLLAGASCADVFVITEIKDQRAASPEELCRIFKEETECPVKVIEDYQQAFSYACKEKGENGELYCLGSLYLIGMLKELLGGE